jgi:Ca2+-binding RTX toxin-like protein
MAHIIGTAGNDTLTGTDDELIEGLAGNDAIIDLL